MKRSEALDLLRQQHDFPGPFDFRVVVRAGTQANVMSAIQATMNGEGTLLSVDERPSKHGKYVAMRLKVKVQRAESVLSIYDIIQKMPEVVTAM